MEKSNKEKRPPPRPTKKGAERSQQDQIWKEILDQSLEDAMAFFFPPYHKRIDWTHGYESLDKEMLEITGDGRFGKQSADKLFKVKLRNGKEEYLLLHIEVQGYTDKHFAERVQYYYWLIWFKYNEQVRSFAILTDHDSNFRQNKVEVKDAGFQQFFQFPMVKLLDYEQEQKWAKLQRSKNPFAIVVMAHLRAMRLKKRPIELKEVKTQLVRMLFERGYSREYVLKLLQFILWIVTLPPDLEMEYRADLRKIIPEEQMRIISSYDRVILEEGLQQRFLNALEVMLKNRFGFLEGSVKERLGNLNADKLESLMIASVSFENISEVTKWLDEHKA